MCIRDRLKVDILALGMLSALRRCFALIERYRATRWTLAGLPQEDAATCLLYTS